MPDAPSLGLSAKWLDALEDRGDAHAAADTQRHQAVLAAGAGEVVKDFYRQNGARGPDRVSEGHCSAYRVELLLRHLQLAPDGDRDGREGLVRLDGVQVVDREPGLLEGQP